MASSQAADVPKKNADATSAPAVARGAFVNLVGTVANLLDTGFLAAVSWLLGASVVGKYVLATAYISMLMRLSVMGLDKGLMRHVPMARASGRREDLAAVLGTALRFSGGFSLVGALGVGLLADQVIAAGGDDPGSGAAQWLAWMVLAVPAQALSTFCLFALRGDHDMVSFVAIRNTLTPLLLFGVGVPAIALGGGEWWMIVAYLCAHGVAAVAALWRFRSAFGGLGLGELLHARYDRELWNFSLPQGLAEFLNLVLTRADVIMIAYFFPDQPALVGIYAVASLLAGAVKKVRQGFDNSLSPVLAMLMAERRQQELNQTYARVARWIFSLFIPLGGVLSLGAPLLLWLFGPDYPQAWLVVPVLVGGRLLNAVGGPAANALLMAGHSRLELFNNLAINVLNVSANAWAIPRYGVMGAAGATASVVTLFNLVRIVQVKRLVGISPHWPDMLRLSAAGVIAGAAGVYLLTLSRSEAMHAASVAVFLAVYVSALWMLGLREELVAAGRLLRGKKTAGQAAGS